MDIEERARLAVARVPSPGFVADALGRHVHVTLLLVAVLLAAALWGLVAHGAVLGIAELLCALAATLVALWLTVRQLRSALRSRRVTSIYLAGDLEGAARAYDELLAESFVLPAWRAVYALDLATVALMAGHPERAMILLRAVQASRSLAARHDAALDVRVVLALLALGRPAEARTALCALLARPTTKLVATPHVGVELLVEALGGTTEVAVGVAERFTDASRQPVVVALARAPGGAMQLAFGWMMVAYAWDRAARGAPPAERADAEARRAGALLLAGDVPSFAYGYLLPAWPDFRAFVARSAAP